MDLEEIKKHLESEDAAAFCIGFAIFLPLDVLLWPGGLPPTTVALGGGVGAVGLKKALEARIKRWKLGRASKNFEDTLIKTIEEMSKDREEHKKCEDMKELLGSLQNRRDLWKNKVIANEDFEEMFNDLVINYIQISETGKKDSGQGDSAENEED